MPRTALLATLAFTAFGTSYSPGEEIPPEDTDLWPEGALVNRLNGGDARYGKVEGESEEEGVLLEKIGTLEAALESAEADLEVADKRIRELEKDLKAAKSVQNVTNIVNAPAAEAKPTEDAKPAETPTTKTGSKGKTAKDVPQFPS